MIKTKLFNITTNGGSDGTTEINQWLEKHQDVGLLAINTLNNSAGWAYIILYDDFKPKDSDGRDDAKPGRRPNASLWSTSAAIWGLLKKEIVDE